MQQREQPIGRAGVAKKLQDMVQSLFGFEVAPSQPLMEAGLDSLSAAELRNSMATAFSAELPATIMFDYPTLDALTTYVTEHVTKPGHPGALSPSKNCVLLALQLTMSFPGI
jgi:acyl carrier protein